jgi:6-phosphofructokinase
MITDKFFKGKNLAILSGGGDTSAINASIDSIRNRASMLGYRVFGIRQGWKGLLGDGDIVDLTDQPYDGYYGGSALRSSRTNPFSKNPNSEDRVSQILRNIKRYKIDVLVTIGGDDTNGAAKSLYELEGIPVIGFPKTIDNDLRTHTSHNFDGVEIESVICPGFPSAATRIEQFASILKTNAESHSRVMVMEVMGRDAGWLTGAGTFGGAAIALVPEIEMTKERKELFFETVREKYSINDTLIISVSEGVKWYDDDTQKTEIVFASSEKDEYGHARLGGISGKIATEITQKLKLQTRSQVTGYYPRGGRCYEYDRRLVSALADKVADLLLRKDYGQMPVMSKICQIEELEEYNCSSVDMSSIGNLSLPKEYYNEKTFTFTPAYNDFLSKIIGKPINPHFYYDFPKILPDDL